MIAVDVAVNDRGEKVFMLASFNARTSTDIVKNLLDETLSPWYRIAGDLKMITPEWIFYRNELKRW